MSVVSQIPEGDETAARVNVVGVSEMLDAKVCIRGLGPRQKNTRCGTVF